MSNRVLQLEGDLRTALENFCQDRVSGPWDDLIEVLANMLNYGVLSLETAGRIQMLLARTQGPPVDKCETCNCPMPDMNHGATRWESA